MPDKFEVRLLPGNRVRADLYGALDQSTAQELEKEMLKVCGQFPPKSLEVLISLVGTTNCALEARPVLAHMQKELAPRARRTAYVDERPLMRGMALWVMHLAADGNAKAVSTEAQAEQWLQGHDDRSQAARMRTVAA